MSMEEPMPDYGYGGGPQQDQLSLYSMMLRQPGMGALGFNMMNPRMMFQQGQQQPPRQQMPWWQQMSRPDQAQDPERKNRQQQQQQQAMQMSQLGLSMLQPRQPMHTGPYPWI